MALERYAQKLMITPKTTLGALIFDCYPSIQHSGESVITSHPVQTGANINDHKFRQPDMLTYQIAMSDCSQDLVEGTFAKKGNESIYRTFDLKQAILNVKETKSLNMTFTQSRSINAFRLLKIFQQSGVVFDCNTRLYNYKNMTVKSVVVPDDATTYHGLKATVVMQEIMPASINEVKVSASSQTTGSTNKGVQTAKPLESVLYKSGGMLPAMTFGILGGGN